MKTRRPHQRRDPGMSPGKEAGSETSLWQGSKSNSRKECHMATQGHKMCTPVLASMATQNPHANTCPLVNRVFLPGPTRPGYPPRNPYVLRCRVAVVSRLAPRAQGRSRHHAIPTRSVEFGCYAPRVAGECMTPRSQAGMFKPHSVRSPSKAL